MPIDTRIYGMIQQPKMAGPLEQFAQAMTVKQLIGQNELADMQRSEMQRGIEKERRIGDLFARGNVKPEEVMGIDLKRGLEYQKGTLDNQKTQGEIDYKKAQTVTENMKILRDQLANVTDDASLGRLREDTMRIFGFKAASGIPQSVSDPSFGSWREQNMMTADKMIVSAEARLADQRTRAGQAETRRHNRVMENQPVWDSERGVFVPRSSAGTSRAPAAATSVGGGATPAAIAPAALPPRSGDIMSLRKEYNDLPEVKNYRSVIPIINSAVGAPDTPAGDIQMAYTIGKIFDPNSVVREGELKLVGDAANILGKFEGELRKLVEGKGRLTPETRRQLLETAMFRVKELEAAEQGVRRTYETTAKARNLPLDQIFADMPKIRELPNTDRIVSGKIGGPSQQQAMAPTRSEIDAELRRRGVIR